MTPHEQGSEGADVLQQLYKADKRATWLLQGGHAIVGKLKGSDRTYLHIHTEVSNGSDKHHYIPPHKIVAVTTREKVKGDEV